MLRLLLFLAACGNTSAERPLCYGHVLPEGIECCPTSEPPTGSCSPVGITCVNATELTCDCKDTGWSCSGGPVQHDLSVPDLGD